MTEIPGINNIQDSQTRTETINNDWDNTVKNYYLTGALPNNQYATKEPGVYVQTQRLADFLNDIRPESAHIGRSRGELALTTMVSCHGGYVIRMETLRNPYFRLLIITKDAQPSPDEVMREYIPQPLVNNETLSQTDINIAIPDIGWKDLVDNIFTYLKNRPSLAQGYEMVNAEALQALQALESPGWEQTQ